MNPDLYACLLPDKKEEYKKLFPEPVIDYTVSAIHVEEWVPSGYAFLGYQVIKLPDAQTYTSDESKPFDMEELKSLFKTWDKLEPDIINGSYFLKLADEWGRESMRKKIEEDLERRLKEAENRNIMQFVWWLG